MSDSKSKIFLLNERSEEITPLQETSYEREAHLQQFLALYPDLLPGDRIATPARRWLFVSREVSVPDSVDSGGRWSLDHLFLDQDGMPTFVECKRSSDTRGRREVVAQMLDYAANGVAHWKTGHIREAFERRCEADGKVAADVLAAFLAGGEPVGAESFLPDSYWERVESNLRDRRIRLIFVADRIAPELKRLVEFLNEELINVEVLAVEVRQYHLAGFSHRVLVPELVGATPLAQVVKGKGRSGVIDPEDFHEKSSGAAQAFHRQLLASLDDLKALAEWGSLGYAIKFPVGGAGRRVTVAYCYPPDKVQYYFDTSLVSAETRRASRDALVQESEGTFTASGQHAANCWIDNENKAKALDALTTAIQRARVQLDSVSGQIQ
ncbi:hypothetical protein OI25_586 [Paraburkholderia fungorum]|uniref:DUF4268 domain-containing protein n=1 Tax=Paraburkholderia fungorum TaxID=134537 RepID=A0AAU8T0E4_9BURK|nr:hypothetical protein [Paraburkholderia fungorum]AJZ59683.1 hypothetical protein OI25_586 [Paraburkholderia fungorum]